MCLRFSGKAAQRERWVNSCPASPLSPVQGTEGSSLREGGIQNNMPQPADLKFLRPGTMTWGFISEKSGDRAAGANRIP